MAIQLRPRTDSFVPPPDAGITTEAEYIDLLRLISAYAEQHDSRDPEAEAALERMFAIERAYLQRQGLLPSERGAS